MIKVSDTLCKHTNIIHIHEYAFEFTHGMFYFTICIYGIHMCM